MHRQVISPLSPPTYGVWLGVRGFLVDGKSDQAVAQMKTVRIYPQARAGDPPTMTFMNGSGKMIDTIFPDTYEYFESLTGLIEKEPLDLVPPTDRFLPASIGIEKDKSFTPDPKMKQLLAEAARVGAAVARANTFASRDPVARVYADRRWEWAFVEAAPHGMRKVMSTSTIALHGTMQPPAITTTPKTAHFHYSRNRNLETA